MRLAFNWQDVESVVYDGLLILAAIGKTQGRHALAGLMLASNPVNHRLHVGDVSSMKDVFSITIILDIATCSQQSLISGTALSALKVSTVIDEGVALTMRSIECTVRQELYHAISDLDAPATLFLYLHFCVGRGSSPREWRRNPREGGNLELPQC